MAKVSLEPSPEAVSLSQVWVKFEQCTIMELRRSSHYEGFENNSERDIKNVSQIDYLFPLIRNLEKFWKTCNEI